MAVDVKLHIHTLKYINHYNFNYNNNNNNIFIEGENALCTVLPPDVWESHPKKNPTLIQAFILILELLNVLLQDRAYCTLIGVLLVVAYLLLLVGSKLSLSFFSSRARWINALTRSYSALPRSISATTLSSVNSPSSVSSTIVSLANLQNLKNVCKASSWGKSP